MDVFDKLYDENEKAHVRFVGFVSNDVRYDFGFIFTDQFFGKPLVVCMQTGRSTLLDPRDVEDYEQIMRIFKIPDEKQARDLAEFFLDTLPSISFTEQYG